MSHVIELTDEQYAAIERGAKEQGVSAQVYLRMLAECVRWPRQTFGDLDAMFRALAMTDEQLAESDRMAEVWFPPDEDDDIGPAQEPPNGGHTEHGER